jgi:hypothetical protein
MLTDAPSFMSKVQDTWPQTGINGTRMYKLVTRLKMLKPVMKALNTELYSDVENSADTAYKELIDCQNRLQLDVNNAQRISEDAEARSK